MQIGKGQVKTNYHMYDVMFGSIIKEKDLGVVVSSDLEVSKQYVRKLMGRQTRY
jgi:hypothetical protein